MRINQKIIVGVVIIFILGFVSIDRFTLYLHKEEEKNIDNMFEHIISSADSVILEANHKFKQIKELNINKEKGEKKIDSLLIKVKQEESQIKSIHKSLELEIKKVDINDKIIDSLKNVCLELKNKLEFRPDSLKYNFIEKDSTIWTYSHDTSFVEVVLVDTILISDEKIIEKIKRKLEKQIID